MKKVILTESQLKKIIKNYITEIERYNPSIDSPEEEDELRKKWGQNTYDPYKERNPYRTLKNDDFYDSKPPKTKRPIRLDEPISNPGRFHDTPTDLSYLDSQTPDPDYLDKREKQTKDLSVISKKSLTNKSSKEQMDPYDIARLKHVKYRNLLTNEIEKVRNILIKVKNRYDRLKSMGFTYTYGEIPELESQIEKLTKKRGILNDLYDNHKNTYFINKGHNPNLLDKTFNFKIPKISNN